MTLEYKHIVEAWEFEVHVPLDIKALCELFNFIYSQHGGIFSFGIHPSQDASEYIVKLIPKDHVRLAWDLHEHFDLKPPFALQSAFLRAPGSITRFSGNLKSAGVKVLSMHNLPNDRKKARIAFTTDVNQYSKAQQRIEKYWEYIHHYCPDEEAFRILDEQEDHPNIYHGFSIPVEDRAGGILELLEPLTAQEEFIYSSTLFRVGTTRTMYIIPYTNDLERITNILNSQESLKGKANQISQEKFFVVTLCDYPGALKDFICNVLGSAGEFTDSVIPKSMFRIPILRDDSRTQFAPDDPVIIWNQLHDIPVTLPTGLKSEEIWNAANPDFLWPPISWQ